MASPELQMVIQMLSANPLLGERPAEEMRAGLEAMAGSFALDPDVRVEPTRVDAMAAEWISAPDTAADRVILYLHGGGYIGTSPTMYSFFTARLCRESRCAVFVADYRLAPEFPYPAGVEDAARVLAELVRRGAPRERLFVAGDSGGGGLATTLVLATPSHVDLETPAGVILFSPEVDLRLDQPSVTDNAPLDILPWNIPTAAYLHGTDPSDGYVSATVADVADFPPTFVAWGDDEMFRDPIREFVARLEGAGVPTDAHEAPGMFHVFPILMPWADASRRVYAAVAAFVAERLAAAPPLHQRTVDGIGS